jgi:hypothetical protein
MGSEGIVPPFWTSALGGGEWSASCTGYFTPGERSPGAHWLEGWVGPRTGLDAVEKRKMLLLPGMEPWLSGSYPIAILTELSRLLVNSHFIEKYFKQKLYVIR